MNAQELRDAVAIVIREADYACRDDEFIDADAVASRAVAIVVEAVARDIELAWGDIGEAYQQRIAAAIRKLA